MHSREPAVYERGQKNTNKNPFSTNTISLYLALCCSEASLICSNYYSNYCTTLFGGRGVKRHFLLMNTFKLTAKRI
jgi:hypothetical protein